MAISISKNGNAIVHEQVPAELIKKEDKDLKSHLWTRFKNMGGTVYTKQAEIWLNMSNL